MACSPCGVEDVGDVSEVRQGLGDSGVIDEVDVQVDDGSIGVVVVGGG
jgi:hypothetical protein